jgi:hypothetical protein
MYHPESRKIIDELNGQISSLKGGIFAKLGNVELMISSKDGIGGFIEEWFGAWSKENGFNVQKQHNAQIFPDYFVGGNGLLEIKTFDKQAGPAFDIANFESYCESAANTPSRVESDYLIFSYLSINGELSIKDIWLKKIWEISSPSARGALKTQIKRDVIYNIRPARWYSDNLRYSVFKTKEDFVDALYKTQNEYTGKDHKQRYLINLERGL